MEETEKIGTREAQIPSDSLCWTNTSNSLVRKITEDVLAKFSLSDILRARCVSKSYNSIITSPFFATAYLASPTQEDVYFILFANESMAAAFSLLDGRWMRLRVAQHEWRARFDTQILFADGVIVVGKDSMQEIVLSSFFTGTSKTLPPSILCPYEQYPLALIDLTTSFMIIVAGMQGSLLLSQMYDSHLNIWKEIKRVLIPMYAAKIENPVFLNGVLFCRARTLLLCLNVESLTWRTMGSLLDLRCPHLLKNEGRLLMIGGTINGVNGVDGIRIWELDFLNRNWKMIITMPYDVFAALRSGQLRQFNTLSGHGFILFCKHGTSRVLLYDIAREEWCWLPACQFLTSMTNYMWIGDSVHSTKAFRLISGTSFLCS